MRGFFFAHTQGGEGLIVPGTERHHLFKVGTHMAEAIMGFHHLVRTIRSLA